MVKKQKKQSGEKLSLKKRPPIIAVVGHVDHGKTTLLDKIRNTSVVEKEAGGITQNIGAWVVKTKERKELTFIDTPGHAAFSQMRSRGIKAADIAVLVVAGNESVKPQTKEALNYIKKHDVPYVVAVTKIDLPSSESKRVEKDLVKLGVNLESKGGEVPVVEVSGKTGEGIDELIEVIGLVAELNEISGSEDAKLEAVVIETDKDKRGTLASVVVINGKLEVGKTVITANNKKAKIRGIFDYTTKSVEEVSPGFPAQIIGFDFLPEVGTVLTDTRIKGTDVGTALKGRPGTLSKGQIPVVIKASSSGVLEAILASIPDKIGVIHSGVGDVNKNDVFLAKTEGSRGIFAFEAKVPANIKKLAQTEDVNIEEFSVIYELMDRLGDIEKEDTKNVLGEAQILAVFPYNNQKVAGCKVISGKIDTKHKIILKREDKKIGEAKILSMKREKKDIKEAKAGEEFGVVFKPQLDFKVSDMLLSTR